MFALHIFCEAQHNNNCREDIIIITDQTVWCYYSIVLLLAGDNEICPDCARYCSLPGRAGSRPAEEEAQGVLVLGITCA